jgi:ABC-type transport system involved in multi-copper enzyme maturation permease subunit
MTERSEVVTGPGGGAADVPPAGEHPFRPDSPTGAGTWSLTWSGVRTVAVLELRQRVRSTRWMASLVVWMLVIGGLSALIRLTIFKQDHSDEAGATMFGVIVFLVLSLGMVISPALSATSINGDRNAGVLAIMQSTLLTPVELAVGKLLAAWVAALGLLVTALPFVLWSYLLGGTPLGRLIVTLVLLSLTLLVVCAIGLGYSALTARTSSSAVLTYVTVTFLALGLPVLFGLTLPLVSSDDTVSRRDIVEVSQTGDVTGSRCETTTVTMERVHTERTWWLLAPSPYVVVADAAPKPAGDRVSDPLTGIRLGVRSLRLGPPDIEDWCSDDVSTQNEKLRDRQAENQAPAWPLGVATDLLAGAGFLILTVRRLRTPADRLPRGTRIA